MRKIIVIAAVMVALALATNANAQVTWWGTTPGPGTTVLTGQNIPDEGRTVTTSLTVQSGATYGGARLLNGGTVNNSGRINLLEWMTGGTFNNNGTVGTANMSGGQFTNNGTILGTLTYSGGDFSSGANGSIGTLVANADITDTNWGAVTNLNFGANGALDLTIKGVNPATGGLLVDGWKGTVSGVVDLTNAAITVGLDWGDLGTWIEAFKASFETPGDYNQDFNVLAGLFGSATLDGTAASFLLSGWDIDDYADYGLTYGGNGTFILAWTVEADLPPEEGGVPEPATLAIFGLGLVGLALTRARRRK